MNVSLEVFNDRYLAQNQNFEFLYGYGETNIDMFDGRTICFYNVPYVNHRILDDDDVDDFKIFMINDKIKFKSDPSYFYSFRGGTRNYQYRENNIVQKIYEANTQLYLVDSFEEDVEIQFSVIFYKYLSWLF